MEEPISINDLPMFEETKIEPWKRVCVLGAGASGLVVMKELNEVGIEVSEGRPKPPSRITFLGLPPLLVNDY